MQYSTKLFTALAAITPMITTASAQLSTETSCIAVSNPEICILGWQFTASDPNSVSAYILNNTCAILSTNADLPIGETTILLYPNDGLFSDFILTNPEVGTNGPTFAYVDVGYSAAEACLCGEGPAGVSNACSCNFICPTPGS